MISEDVYLEMKKLIADYETEQINKEKDSTIVIIEPPYLETIYIKKKVKYNPKYGDDKVCKCGHPYYRHFDTYEQMETVGCKYCECFYFEEQ